MEVQIKLWVALAALAVMVPVVGWVLRWGINQIVSKLDELIKLNAKMNSELIRQNNEIVNAKDNIKELDIRLNNHADRIRDIELIQAQCSYNPRR